MGGTPAPALPRALDERDRTPRFAEVMAALNVLRPWSPLTEGETELWARLTAAVPVSLLEAGTAQWLRTQDRFPTPHQFLTRCEEVRKEAYRDLRATQYPPCGRCSQDGWIEKEIDGVRRAMRCPCVVAFQHACARLGWPMQPLALPPGLEPLEE